MTNRDKIYTIIFWIINCMYVFAFIYWVLLNRGNTSVVNNYNLNLFPWVFGLILVQMVSFKIKNVLFCDFALWFSLISYMFMFGFLFSSVFNLDSNLLWNPISNYSDIELFKSYVFVILCLEMFSFGYLSFYNEKKVQKKNELRYAKSNRHIYNIGCVLLLIGSITKILNDIQIVFTTQSANSYSAYASAVSSGIIDDLSYLMLPGIFFVFFSGCIKERTKKSIFLIVLIYLVCIMILTGSRKIQIFSILSLFLGFEFSSEKSHLSIKNFLVYLFLALILINIIIIIRDNRFNLESVGPEILKTIFSFDLFGNILGETFAETGITILSVASIIKLVPVVKPFQYGLTFLRTIPSFLPIGWLVGDFFYQASSTYVINSYLQTPVGSSLIGDFYWNWGFVGGIIASFISGVIIFKLVNINDSKNIRKNYAMYFSFFSQLIILVRGEVFDIYRPIIMLVIIVFIMERINIFKRRIIIR